MVASQARYLPSMELQDSWNDPLRTALLEQQAPLVDGIQLGASDIRLLDLLRVCEEARSQGMHLTELMQELDEQELSLYPRLLGLEELGLVQRASFISAYSFTNKPLVHWSLTTAGQNVLFLDPDVVADDSLAPGPRSRPSSLAG